MQVEKDPERVRGRSTKEEERRPDPTRPYPTSGSRGLCKGEAAAAGGGGGKGKEERRGRDKEEGKARRRGEETETRRRDPVGGKIKKKKWHG